MKLNALQKFGNSLFFLALLAGVLLAAGCVQNTGKNTGQGAVQVTPQPGTAGSQGLQIVLKDPGMPEVRYLRPSITEVQLQEKTGQWTTIWSDPSGKPVVLTPDGAEMVLDTVAVPPGTYAGTRLKVSTIDVQVDVNRDGDTTDKNVQVVLTLEEFNKLPPKDKPSTPSTPTGMPSEKPTTPAVPTTPAMPTTPAKPERSVGAAGEEKPSKPVEPSQPQEPTQPAEPTQPQQPGGTPPQGGEEPSTPYTIVGDLVYMPNYLDETHIVTLNDYVAPLGEDMWKTDFVYDGSSGALVYDLTLDPLAPQGGQVTVNVTYRPLPPNAVSSLALSPDPVTGGTISAGTVTLERPAGASGQIVQLSASPAGTVILPANITVAAGSTSGTFNIVTPAVTSPVNVTVAASIGDSRKTAQLTINPAPAPVLSAIAVSPASVVGGGVNAMGTVTLTGPAPAGGTVVTLGVSSPPTAFLTPTVTVKAGEASASFNITTYRVGSPVTVTFAAMLNGVQKTAQLVVNPITRISLTSVTLNPPSLTYYTGSYPGIVGTVTLSGPAPAGGQFMFLYATPSGYLSLPQSMTIGEGARNGTFQAVLSGQVTQPVNVTITASTYPDASQKSATLAILLPVTTTPQPASFDVTINSLTCTWFVKTVSPNVRTDCVRIISNGTAKGPVGARLELPILAWSDDKFDCGSWTYKSGALIAVGSTCTRGANQPESTAWTVDTEGDNCPMKEYFATSITHTVKIYNDNEIFPQDTDSRTAKCG